MPAAEELQGRDLAERAWQQGRNLDWLDVGAASIDTILELDHPEGVSAEERSRRVAFTQNTLTEVLNHTGELVVFHRFVEDGAFHQFRAILPSDNMPFEVSAQKGAAADYSDATYFLAIYQFGRELPPTGTIDVPSGREITYAEGDNDYVFMGGGVRFMDRSPDGYYEAAIDGHASIAVGNDAITELFERLGAVPDAERTKLFKSLFHVAMLADEFDVSVPKAVGYDDHLSAAQEEVEGFRKISDTVIESDRAAYGTVLELSRKFHEEREAIEELAEQQKVGIILPAMHDSRVWPFIDLYDYGKEEAHLKSFMASLDRERKEHVRRHQVLQTWESVLQRMIQD